MSPLQGTLSVDGNANLFLMNPNGIVFGENAAIDVGGSFLTTTAENIKFNSGDRFSALSREKPLLTIDFPVGLGLDSPTLLCTFSDAIANSSFNFHRWLPTA